MSQRLYNNIEIQEKISKALQNLSDADLDKFCRKSHSKVVFDIKNPLVLKVPTHFTESEKMNAIKDEKGMDRYTWAYEFERNGFLYAMHTQWHARNDVYVQRWLADVA